jgi:hypothetical protein
MDRATHPMRHHVQASSGERETRDMRNLFFYDRHCAICSSYQHRCEQRVDRGRLALEDEMLVKTPAD